MKSFVVLAAILLKSGHRRCHLSDISLVFLDFPDLTQWQDTCDKNANQTFQFLDHSNNPGAAADIENKNENADVKLYRNI